MKRVSVLLVFAMLTAPVWAAETCTTQSAMAPADRAALADATRTIALAVQSNDAATLRALSTPEIQQNFGALQYMVAMTSPKLTGATPQVDQLYLLDASALKAGDSSSEAQFFCSLNKTTQEVDFSIPGLTAGRYGFAIATIQSRPAPWRISLLLRQDATGKWLIAGFYPKPSTIAGHDGLWFWNQARAYAQKKQLWNAWLSYQAAQTLLRPTDFILSTHLEKLRTEATSAAPPALSEGISPETPLVVKAVGAPPAPVQKSGNGNTNAALAASTDFRFTALSFSDPATPGAATPMLSAHLRADSLTDPTAARQRNMEAAKSLLAAYPELRTSVDSISITTESPNQPPLTTTFPIADVK